MARRGLVMWCCLGFGAMGCTRPMVEVLAVNELTSDWELFPHRLSVLELALRASGAGRASMAAQLDGGGFGALDHPRVRLGISVLRSTQLAYAEGSITVPLPPGSQSDKERYAASAELAFPSASFEGASAVAAWIRGFRLATSDGEVSSPPTYDPANGYTTQGLGIALGPPELRGGSWVVPMRVRNVLGPSDRADMNAAIPLATTWVRVDVALAGTWGRGRSVAAKTSYDLSTLTYGTQTSHPHGTRDQQRLLFRGAPGVPEALFGLSAFDFWVNLPGRHDPRCTVVQDEVTPTGERVSGPGRYVTTLSVRVAERSYDSSSGEGEAHLDLFLSNRSAFHEEGNLCVRVEGAATMLQVDDAASTLVEPKPWVLGLESMIRAEREVTF